MRPGEAGKVRSSVPLDNGGGQTPGQRGDCKRKREKEWLGHEPETLQNRKEPKSTENCVSREIIIPLYVKKAEQSAPVN